jgi:hypothetical protein
MAWLESQIHVKDAQKAAQEQAGANQQYARQRNLGDNQGRTQALMLFTLACRRACVLNRPR